MKKIILFALALILAACSSTPKVDLSGEWKLVSYGDASNPTPALPDVDTFFKFENGQLSGNVGCNGFGGEYQIKGDAATFGPLMSTEMYCEKIAMQEQSVIAVFASGEVNVQRNGDTLTITSSEGSSVINLARK